MLCDMQGWLLSLTLYYFILYNFHTPRDILKMFGRSIFQFKTVCLVQEWLLSLASRYELSPMYVSL